VNRTWLITLAIVAVLAIPPVLVLHSGTSVLDPDVWWHLRVGEWIVQHHAVPRVDYFSYTRQGQPWVAYSWLHELMMYGLYKGLGLRGLVLFSAASALAIARTLLGLLLRYISPVFAAGLTAVAMYLIYPMILPRPGMFTIVFFILQLQFVWRARIEKRTTGGWWIPALYLIWANVHIQFVYGLFVLGVAAIEPWISRILRQEVSDEDWKVSQLFWKLLGLSVLATLVNPYLFGLYAVVWQYAQQTKAFDYIIELQALDFRRAKDYIELLLAMAAALMLGLRRHREPFVVILLIAASFAAFRAERDSWFLAAIALSLIAVLAQCKPQITLAQSQKAIMGMATMLAIAVGAVASSNFDESSLRQARDKNFPSQAAQFLESQQYTGPLFNILDWGGYLIWRLPQMQVAIDGRTNLYGDDYLSSMVDSWDGKPAWVDNTELTKARTILAPKAVALTFILANMQKYRIVYEDERCIILVTKQPET
jgi:hypothetical protein